MLKTLAILGLAQTARTIFNPILEDIAKQATANIASSYIAKAFEGVYSVINKDALAKATGRAVKELLDLIEDELVAADYSDDEIRTLIPHVKLFIEQDAVRACIQPLFIDPDYQLDPKVFADAWETTDVPTLPSDFSWQRISRLFVRKVSAIRNDSNDELKETFDALQNNRNSEALKELAGLPPEFDLDTYREALVERFGNLSFDSIDTSGANYNAVRLWSVFVAQSARECHAYQPQLLELPKEHQKRLIEQGELDKQELQELERLQKEQRQAYYQEPKRSVLDICADTELSNMVILGDPGSGKSTLLRFLALQWARIEDPNQRYTQTLPILIELRDYNLWDCNKGKSFISYLHHASTWHRLNQQTLDSLLKQPERVLLLLDGLDEVFDPIQREQVINDIHRFSNEYKNTRIIVTSRIVGYKARRLRDAEFKDFMLQDLDDDQVDQFLHHWHEVTFEDKQEAKTKRKRLAKAIKASKAIQMLAGNPLLLTMMAIINRYQELPRDRNLLYEKAAEVLLQQWDTERGLENFPEINKEIDLRAKVAILRKIAYHMQTGRTKGEAANIIQGEALITLIEEYLQEELGFQQSRQAANALVKQLRERNFILCFLGADSYAFVHRTFLEYFCASELVHRFHKEKTLTIDELIEVFDHHCRDDDWSEVLRLICGQIDEPFVGKIVEHLATRTDFETWDGKTPLLEIPLAIWCLGEVKNLAKLSDAGGVLFDSTCKVFKGANIDSPRSFFNELISATKILGVDWPNRKEIDTSQELNSESYDANFYWPQFVATVSNNKNQVINFSLSSSWSVRVSAYRALADYWSDNDTRRLLTKCAVQDKHGASRSIALQILAKHWADDDTRHLLMERAVQDKDESPRRTALEILAKHWTDNGTRCLLMECVVQDKHESPRCTALETLAKHWADDDIRRLLMERAVQDEDEYPRYTALKMLAEHWADNETHALIRKQAVLDGGAASLLGKEYSQFGEIIFSKYLIVNAYSYLDPQKAIPTDHIKEAAEATGIKPEDLPEEIKKLSEHMGWDITKGSGR